LFTDLVSPEFCKTSYLAPIEVEILFLEKKNIGAESGSTRPEKKKSGAPN